MSRRFYVSPLDTVHGRIWGVCDRKSKGYYVTSAIHAPTRLYARICAKALKDAARKVVAIMNNEGDISSGKMRDTFDRLAELVGENT